MRFEGEARVSKASFVWRAVLFGIAMVAIAGPGIVTGRFGLAPSLAMLVAGVVGMIEMSRLPRAPGKKTRPVAADDTGLFVDGRRVLGRSSIVRALAVERDGGVHAVHVEGRRPWGTRVVFVDSAEKGRALIDALQLPVDPATARFRALPPWAKHLRWLAVVLTASPWVFVNSLRLLPGWGICAILGLYALLLVPTLLPQRVDVGHDGVFLRWLGNKQFIPFSSIGQITKTKVGVELFLRTGRHHEIQLTQKDGAAEAQLAALVARIEAGMAAQQGRTRAEEEALLTRGGRDLETWLREMRALGTGAGGYRVMAIARERLWDIIENPSADPSAREGAALALSSTLDDEDRARLVALAQRTASPRLRVALDGVSRETDEPRLRVALETAERELSDHLDDDDAPAAQKRLGG